MKEKTNYRFAIGKQDEHAYITVNDSYEARNLARVLAEAGVDFEFTVYTPEPRDYTKLADDALDKAWQLLNEQINELELEKAKVIDAQASRKPTKGKAR